jgi:regulator of RNase E activity RraA
MPPLAVEPFPGSCDVSDACDDLGIVAVRTGGLRPVWSGCPALLGRVRTLTLAPDPDADPLPEVLAALAAIPAGDIAFVDLDGRTDVQCWGGRTAGAARRAEVAGALVNGAVRDVAALRSLAFPTFAVGSYPARAKGRLRFRGTGNDVVLGAGTVRSGSAVVADDDGLVFFPYEAAGEVLARARVLAVGETGGADGA